MTAPHEQGAVGQSAMAPAEAAADRALRLECLRLAQARGFCGAGETVQDAEAYYAFACGRPALGPRAAIDAALEAAGVR